MDRPASRRLRALPIDKPTIRREVIATVAPAAYLSSPYTEAALTQCGIPREDPSFTGCIDDYWQMRIAREFDSNFGWNPEYGSPYYDYLSLKVQQGVAEMLNIERNYPNWDRHDEKIQRTFDIEEGELDGYSWPESDERADARRRRAIAAKINTDLEAGGYPQRIIFNLRTPLQDIFNQLRYFFDEIKVEWAKHEVLRRDVTAASLILLNVVESIPTCETFAIRLDQVQHADVVEFLTAFTGVSQYTPAVREIVTSLAPPGGGIRQGGRTTKYIGGGSMLVFYFGNQPAYRMFINEKETQLEVVDLQGQDMHHLPQLFVDFLKAKGLIRVAAQKLYPIFGLMQLTKEDEWI